MFILTANQSCGFPEPPKIIKILSVLKNGLNYKEGLFKGQKCQMGHEKIYVRDVEAPYGHPPQNYPKSLFPIDFFMLFQTKHVARSKPQVTWSR